MTGRTLGQAQLALAVLALLGSVASWLSSTSTEAVAPVAEGEPSLTSTIYSPTLVLLALFLAGVAGVAAVAGIARLRAR